MTTNAISKDTKLWFCNENTTATYTKTVGEMVRVVTSENKRLLHLATVARDGELTSEQAEELFTLAEKAAGAMGVIGELLELEPKQ